MLGAAKFFPTLHTRGNSFSWQSVGSRQDISNIPTNPFVLSRIALRLSLYCQECFPLNLLFYIRKPLIGGQGRNGDPTALIGGRGRNGDPTAVLQSQGSSRRLQPPLRASTEVRKSPLAPSSTLQRLPRRAPSSNLPQLLKDLPFPSSLFSVS